MKKDKKTDPLKKSNKKEIRKKTKEIKKKKDDAVVKNKKSSTSSEKNLKSAFLEINKQYQTLHDTPKSYGSDHLYYPSEINVLEVIGKTPNINLTAIAKALNISKSAVSKGILKLLNKGMITKERSSITNREVIFNLSDNGHLLYDNVKITHKKIYAQINQVFKNLSSDEKKTLSNFTSALQDALTAGIKEQHQ